MSHGAIVIEGRIRVPADVFDLERFRDWAHSAEFPATGQYSYIGGDIEVDMSPEEIESHNKLKGRLFLALGVRVEADDIGELLADRAFLVHAGAELATEPDITFCSWDALRSGRVRYAEHTAGSARFVEVVGSPDLVVEVVSQSSVRKDNVLLRERYFRADIPEYWIADGRGGGVALEILVRGPEGYIAVPPDADGFRRSTVLGRSFRIVRERNPVGGAAYRVHDR